MKIACGVDIIEISRIEKAIERQGEKFLNTVYTENEIQYCESHKINKFQHYAARFAAKEALYKALSEIIPKESLKWTAFEITNDENGKPKVNINFDKIKDIDISISHCKEYATANIVVIYDE